MPEGIGVHITEKTHCCKKWFKKPADQDCKPRGSLEDFGIGQNVGDLGERGNRGIEPDPIRAPKLKYKQGGIPG